MTILESLICYFGMILWGELMECTYGGFVKFQKKFNMPIYPREEFDKTIYYTVIGIMIFLTTYNVGIHLNVVQR